MSEVPFLVPFFYIIVPIVGIVTTYGLLKWIEKKEASHS